MKLTFNWLKEFVDFAESPETIAERLTMAGLEVESLAPVRGPDGVGEDWMLEVGVTPNRGDCLGILGLAREVAVLTGGHLRFPPASPAKKDAGIRKIVDVRILNQRLCPRYSARIVENVSVRSSPPWMRFRLEECGIRSINNVVDVTNYVMLETGQPLHAFDMDRLQTKQIIVREARGIKEFVTLDDVKRDLAPGDLLICDGETPVALAGVMGGKDSEVRLNTRRVLLESANFDPVAIRRTAKRLGLRSEASHRFERGVDPEGTLPALARAVFLLREVAGGTPVEGIVDRYPGRSKQAPIFLRHEKVEGVLGLHIKATEVGKILQSLGLKIQGRSKSGLKVVPPSYRRDLTREADLIEELARICGYEKIPTTLPLMKLRGAGPDLRLRQERKMRSYLGGEGLAELINLPFTSSEMNRLFYGLWEGQGSPVSILNPLRQESAEMRLSLIPGLVENLRFNLAQRAKGLWGFNLGKVFYLEPEGSLVERQHLAAILQGQRERRGLRRKEAPLDFLDLKGLVEGLLEVVGIKEQVAWTADGLASFLHLGKAAFLELEPSRIGYLGEVHPDLCGALSMPSFLIFELDFEKLIQYAPREFKARPLPRFPSVERDLAVVVDEDFPAQRIVRWIKDLNRSLIEDVEVFDQYRGSPIPEGKKSLAYKICYRAEDRTLTDAEVNAIHESLISQLGEVFGAQLRT